MSAIREAYEDALRMLDANEPAGDALAHFARAVFAEGEPPADVEVAREWLNSEGFYDSAESAHVKSLARLLAEQRRGLEEEVRKAREFGESMTRTANEERNRMAAEVRRLRGQAEVTHVKPAAVPMRREM